MKFFLFMVLSAGLGAGLIVYGDDMPIPKHFLASEEKDCLRQAMQYGNKAQAESYCSCVTDGLDRAYKFGPYLWRNAEIGLAAHSIGQSTSEVAGQDQTLRAIHHQCFQQVLEESRLPG